MKLLLTGSTAAHVSARKNAVSATFTRLVHDAVVSAGHEVTWVEPSVHMSREYIAGFDSVLVGMAPPNSTAAHRIYGALSVIEHANNIGNLHLMVDAPEPKKVWAGIRAIHNKPDELTKDFYAKRKEYQAAREPDILARLLSAIRDLYLLPWPKTIYPALPWISFPSVSAYVPRTSSRNLVGINLDEMLIVNGLLPENLDPDYWAADQPSSAWTLAMKRTLHHSVVPTSLSRQDDDTAVRARMSTSIGCLVSTYRHGDPWWSPALAQALSVAVPVATDWRLSSSLGPSWSILPATMEEMTPGERFNLSYQQRDTYLSGGLPLPDSVGLLCRTLFTT